MKIFFAKDFEELSNFIATEQDVRCYDLILLLTGDYVSVIKNRWSRSTPIPFEELGDFILELAALRKV